MDKSISEVYRLKNIISVKFKITSIEESIHHLYIGDSSGYLHKYFLIRTETDFLRETNPNISLSSSQQSNQLLSKQITSSKIDIIKALPFGRDLLVLSNSNLYHVDGESLVIKQTLVSGGVTNLTLNESNAHKNEVLLSMKNNKLVVLEFNINTYEFLKEKLVLPPLPDTLLTIAFLGNLIYYGTKKEYGLIDLNKKLQPTPLSMTVSPFPHIKVTDNDELFILVTNTNTGLLIGRDGIPKHKATFEPLVKPMLQVAVQKPYMIMLYEGALQIFNTQDSKKLQEIELQGGAKKFVASQGAIIYATQQKLTLLLEVPFQSRIRDCLKTCRIDDAMGIFYQSVHKDDPTFKEKEEGIYLDAAWNLIEQARFRDARLKLENREFDIREILALFKDFIPTTMKNKVDTTNKTIETILGRMPDKARLEMHEKEAFEMVIELLEKRRSKYSNPQFRSQMNQRMLFVQSEYSLGKQSTDITLAEILMLIDYALIKIYVKRRYSLQLSELFKTNKPINCRDFFPEIQQFMREAQYDQKEPEIIAYFLEKFGRIKEALDKWKEIGQNLNQKYDIPCNETIRILLNEDSKRITEYLGWTIKKNVEFGKEFFKKVKETVISPDQMLAYLSEGVYSKTELGLTDKLIEIYLEIIVTEKKVTESRFHTRLASAYIDSLLKLMPPKDPTNADPKDVLERLSDFGKKLLKKLQQFYQNPSSNYDPSFLLEKVKGTWLVNEEIYFYGKSKKHREALEQLINKLRAYKQAEDYCLQHGDKTLTIMFQIYIQQYKRAVGYLKQQMSTEQQQQMQQIKKDSENRINIFIKKYSAHPDLDALEVLREIPDDWKLIEFSQSRLSSSDDGLYSFLTQIVSGTLHIRRQVNCAKHLSEMDLQNVKCQLINSKRANVRITEDKKCAICHKAIGDQIVCIYPNAVVAHQKCVTNGQSLSICPQTLQDFEKTFRG